MTDNLNLDMGWRIGEENFKEIVHQIGKIKPKVIVEFGAGPSSIRLSQAFKKTKVYSIDHDIEYFYQAEQLRETHHAENLHLSLRPLKWQTHGFAVYQSYLQADLPKEIDAVIIDGPPHYTFCGREACLYQVYENLRIGGLVILDDCDRLIEKNHVANWLARYPGAFLRRSGSENDRICILVKEKNTPVRLDRDVLVANYSSLIRKIYDGDIIVRIRKFYVSVKRWLEGLF